MTVPPPVHFFPDSQPVKRPFAPSESGTSSSLSSMPVQENGRTFSRTDSRGSYREAAQPPTDIQDRLSSVGMRARMNIERGFAPSTSQGSVDLSTAAPAETQASANATTPTAHPASLRNSTRSVWARTMTAPNYHHENELVPFAASGGSELPFWGETRGAAEQGVNGRKRRTVDGQDDNVEDAHIPIGAEQGKTADQVLEGLMSDDEDADDSMDVTTSAPAPPTDAAAAPSRPAHRLPKRTFAHAQTMPASSALASHLAGSGDGALQRTRDDMDTDGDHRYRAWKFEEWAQKADF